MGMQVKIRIVGRKSGSEQWLDDAYSMYETRLQSSLLDVETVWHKNDAELIKGVAYGFEQESCCRVARSKGHNMYK